MDRNPVASQRYAAKEIPKFKHQIPNKSQMAIPNDQNIHDDYVVKFKILRSAVTKAVKPIWAWISCLAGEGIGRFEF